MSESPPPTALVRVRQYGGTYLAGAKIGNSKQVNASCTAGEKPAAKRAAAKAFECSEDDIELKGVTSSSTACFWATRKAANPPPATT